MILNQLYKHTRMQTTFGIILLAIVDGRPVYMTLRQMIGCFIDHRREVIVRRTRFLLDKAEKAGASSGRIAGCASEYR